MPSIRKNYAYNLIYQVLTLLTPFITTPYISRVLGPEGTGVQSYTNSVVQYFAILAALGTASYGQREVARHRDDLKERSRIFWEIQLLCAFTTTVCLAVWMFVIGFSEKYAAFYGVLTMTLAAVAFDISWFFGGLEQYQMIVARNMAVKILGIVLLFLFIKSRNDLLLYVALIAATGLLGNLSMWPSLSRYIVRVDIRSLRIIRHLKETMIYFIPTIATSVYTILDKTMLGWFTGNNKSENGYYEYATGFVNMAKVVIMSFNAVMSARMSYLFAEGRTEEIQERIENSLHFVMLLGMPVLLGLAGIAPGFIPWFLGQGYEPVIVLLYVCCPLVLIVGLSDCLGSQILTPGGLRAKSAKVIVAGAVINGTLNLILIPLLGASGAALASVTAEVFITILYIRLCRSYVSLSLIWHCAWKRLLAAGVMFAAVSLLGRYLKVGAAATFAQIGAGAIVYFAVLAVFRDQFLLEQIRKRLENRISLR